MREVVLDTETTGLDPDAGHRVVEIGCIELINHMPTGRTYQQYLNPERDVPLESFRIHGLSEAFLADKPVFAAVADEFMEFVGDASLVIHNAAFDLKFLNAELKRLNKPPLGGSTVVDTLQIARTRYPGASASLDELCRRFGVDNSHRERHGALLDAELLADVYIDLIGAREPGFDLRLGVRVEDVRGTRSAPIERPVRPPRPHAPSAEEAARHAAFLERLKQPIWLQ